MKRNACVDGANAGIALERHQAAVARRRRPRPAPRRSRCAPARFLALSRSSPPHSFAERGRHGLRVSRGRARRAGVARPRGASRRRGGRAPARAHRLRRAIRVAPGARATGPPSPAPRPSPRRRSRRPRASPRSGCTARPGCRPAPRWPSASPLACPTDIAVRTLTWNSTRSTATAAGRQLLDQVLELALQPAEALGQRHVRWRADHAERDRTAVVATTRDRAVATTRHARVDPEHRPSRIEHGFDARAPPDPVADQRLFEAEKPPSAARPRRVQQSADGDLWKLRSSGRPSAADEVAQQHCDEHEPGERRDPAQDWWRHPSRAGRSAPRSSGSALRTAAPLPEGAAAGSASAATASATSSSGMSSRSSRSRRFDVRRRRRHRSGRRRRSAGRHARGSRRTGRRASPTHRP